MKQRTSTALAAASAALLAAVLAAAPANAHTGEHTVGPTGKRAPRPAAAAQPAAQASNNVPESAEPCPRADMVKVAFVFEGAPSSLATHSAAVRSVTEQLGTETCIRTFDRLSSGVDPDANARFLLGALGLQQYAVVLLLTPRHTEALTKVARQFPATTYLQFNGRVATDNLIPYRPKVAGTADGDAIRPRGDWTQFYRDVAQCASKGKRVKAPAAGVGTKGQGAAEPAELCPAA